MNNAPTETETLDPVENADIMEGCEVTSDGYDRWVIFDGGENWWIRAVETDLGCGTSQVAAEDALQCLGPTQKAAARYLTERGFTVE